MFTAQPGVPSLYGITSPIQCTAEAPGTSYKQEIFPPKSQPELPSSLLPEWWQIFYSPLQ